MREGRHEKYTRDEWGRYRHPFAGESPSVSSIHYPDSHTFSVKLRTDEKRHKEFKDTASLLDLEKKNSSWSTVIRQLRKQVFRAFGVNQATVPTTYQTTIDSFYELLYVGEV